MKKETLMTMYPAGTRIRLIRMQGEPQMEKGLEGVVTFIDDYPQVHMQWENGSSLRLDVENDLFEIVDTIKVIKVKTGELAEISVIENKLKSIQSYVDGYIELYGLEENVLIICNEEGKFTKLPNRVIHKDGKILDIIFGDFLVCGMTYEGDFDDLAEDKMEYYLDYFNGVR